MVEIPFLGRLAYILINTEFHVEIRFGASIQGDCELFVEGRCLAVVKNVLTNLKISPAMTIPANSPNNSDLGGSALEQVTPKIINLTTIQFGTFAKWNETRLHYGHLSSRKASPRVCLHFRFSSEKVGRCVEVAFTFHRE